jgi:Domain of unknown function (DUF5916)/Carbohydrate family 9 binding domain-like
MLKSLLILLLLTISLTVFSQTKKIILRTTNLDIKIDGIIDPIWSSADSVTDFFQLSPYYNKPTTVKTVAKILTTGNDLYALMICYENEKNVTAFTGMQDDFAGDIVSLMLDTFGDNKTAYKFAVNASGVKGDSRLLDDGRNRDYSWDGIWFSSAKIYSWGYVVEWKIPYKSIQYDDKLNEWGLGFDRWRAINSEDIYWNKYNQNEGLRVSKFGKLIFQDFHPTVHGLNLEIYPVGFSKATYINNGKYKIDPEAGLDILYNPSPKLKFQLTANPDFAQIEADPYNFNISRYESFFDERRPFFTEGSEIFTASGKERNTGFYQPLNIFYSRRIGKVLPDGSTVPLITGAKAFGRLNDWEYGGFAAITGEKDYMVDDTVRREQRAYFASGRIKKNIFENSSIGLLYVGKQTSSNTYSVIDVDGAFRTSAWQLSYQVARSIKNSGGDYAASAGFIQFGEKFANFSRLRFVGTNFDISQIGYVPWTGTTQITTLHGPIFKPDKGTVSQIFPYGGLYLYHKAYENYTDHGFLLGYNMNFRSNWGFELDFLYAKSKDVGIIYNGYELDVSSWFSINPSWNANVYGGYAKTYNFSRDYIGYYTWLGLSAGWKVLNSLELGTSGSINVENKLDGSLQDITYNARPYFSFTPVNNMNLRVYIDNLYETETDHLERIIVGILFSYNFLPKSWIYFAINQLNDRSAQFDQTGNQLPERMHLTSRAAVMKIKYLYYF